MREQSAEHSDRSFPHVLLRRIAILGIAYGCIAGLEYFRSGGLRLLRRMISLNSWADSQIALQTATFNLSASVLLLIVGAIALLCSRWWGRFALVAYAIATLVKMVITIAMMVVSLPWDVTNLLSYGFEALPASFALLVVWMVSQPEVSSLWRRSLNRNAFEVFQPAGAEALSAGERFGPVVERPSEPAVPVEKPSRGFRSRLELFLGVLAILHGALGSLGILLLVFRRQLIYSISQTYPLATLEHIAWVAYLVLIVGGFALLRGRCWGRRVVIVWAWWQLIAYGILGIWTIITRLSASEQLLASGWSRTGYVISCLDSTLGRMLFPLIILFATFGSRGQASDRSASPTLKVQNRPQGADDAGQIALRPQD